MYSGLTNLFYFPQKLRYFVVTIHPFISNIIDIISQLFFNNEGHPTLTTSCRVGDLKPKSDLEITTNIITLLKQQPWYFLNWSYPVKEIIFPKKQATHKILTVWYFETSQKKKKEFQKYSKGSNSIQLFLDIFGNGIFRFRNSIRDAKVGKI